MNNGCYIQNTYKYAADKDERILFMNDILTKINDTMYTYILLVLLAGAGIYFTVRTSVCSVTALNVCWKKLPKEKTAKKRFPLSRL